MAQTADSTTTPYRTQDEVFSVKSISGSRFNIRIVPPGGMYGREDRVVNKGGAMVEFYWPTTEELRQGWIATSITPPSEVRRSKWKRFGNFTGARYNLTTLLRGHHKNGGLSLNETTSFDAATMNKVLLWAIGGDPESLWG